MAVYTQIHKNELSILLENYNMGSISEFKGIAAGVENTNYFLATSDNKKYIFTIYEKRTLEKDLPYYLEAMSYFSKNNIFCPKPVYNNNNSVISYIKNKPCAIVTFLDGETVFNIKETHIEKLGQYVATMHIKGLDFNMRKENSMSLKSWFSIFNELSKTLNTIEKDLNQEIGYHLQFLEKHWPKGLDSGVIHGDIFPDNVLFKNDEISGIIDFYFACNDFFAYDLAICINAWCFEDNYQLNTNKVKILINSYNKIRTISKKEIESLNILCYGSALRFFLTRVYDNINYNDGSVEVNFHDPLEYLTKTRFHSNINSYKDYGL